MLQWPRPHTHRHIPQATDHLNPQPCQLSGILMNIDIIFIFPINPFTDANAQGFWITTNRRVQGHLAFNLCSLWVCVCVCVCERKIERDALCQQCYMCACRVLSSFVVVRGYAYRPPGLEDVVLFTADSRPAPVTPPTPTPLNKKNKQKQKKRTYFYIHCF